VIMTMYKRISLRAAGQYRPPVLHPIMSLNPSRWWAQAVQRIGSVISGLERMRDNDCPEWWVSYTVLLSSSSKFPWDNPYLRHDRFLPRPFHFISHLSYQTFDVVQTQHWWSARQVWANTLKKRRQRVQ